MGTSDLTKDLHARETPDRAPLLTSLGLVLLAARAHGLAALDGVHLDLADDDGVCRRLPQGRELGFDGKTLIHPKQIAPANAAFAPERGRGRAGKQDHRRARGGAGGGGRASWSSTAASSRTCTSRPHNAPSR